MTDSILRSYYNVTSSSFVPFTSAGDTTLLAGETDGLAIDFTDTTYFDTQVWDQDWNQVRTASVDSLTSPHTFYTNSGTSAKVVKVSSTTLGWSPHNLNLQSQTLSNAAYTQNSVTITADQTTAPDGTLTADQIAGVGATTTHTFYVTAGLGSFSNFILTGSAYFKFNTQQYVQVKVTGNSTNTNWIAANFDIQNGTVTDSAAGSTATLITSSITNVGSGWYRCSVTGIAANTADNPAYVVVTLSNSATPTRVGFGDISFLSNSADLCYCWGLQLNRGIAPTASIATTTAAVIGLPISYGEGLLVEPAGTNSYTYSEDYTQAAWGTDDAPTFTPGQIAPDGSSTATLMVQSGASAIQDLYRNTNFSVTTLTNYTHSAHIKLGPGTPRYVSLSVAAAATDWFCAVFDLQTATVTQQVDGGALATIVSAAITSIGNDWYRISVTGNTTGVTQGVGSLAMALSGTPSHGSFGNVTIAGDGVSGIYIWGIQGELGTIATSYIPTTSASVTRAKDVVEGTVSTVSATENSIYWDGIHKELQTSSFGEMYIFGTDAIGWQQWQALTSTAYRFEVDNTTTQVNMTVNGGSAAGVRTQTSVALKANDFAFSANGAAVGANTDVSGTMPSTGTTALDLGHDAGVAGMNGFIRRFIQVPRRVIDADLPTWRYNF